MKSDLGQSSGKQNSHFFRDISREFSVCIRERLFKLSSWNFWPLLHRREEYKEKESRNKHLLFCVMCCLKRKVKKH